MASNDHYPLTYLREVERQTVTAQHRAQEDLRDILAELNAPMHKVIEAYRIMQRFADLEVHKKANEQKLTEHPDFL